MQYRNYGQTGLSVSVLGYGAMRLPFDDMDQSVALLRAGLDMGINYIDTAFVYGGEGRSEIAVGRAIADRRDRVYIASKNPLFDETVDGWWKRLNTTLERLQTDYIDFYKVVHGLSWDVYQRVYEPLLLREVEKAREQGLIRHVVFSTHDTPENIIKLIQTGRFEGLLLQYNLLDRANEPAIAAAMEAGMGVEVMGPVGGGRLGMASDRITSVSQDVQSTPDAALRFVLSNPGVTVAFSGMSTLDQITANVATASREEPLTDVERQNIARMLEENKRLAELYCTGCNYCLPCEQGVAIPEIFAAMNHHRVWGLTELAKRMYQAFGPHNKDGKRSAAECIQCGVCETRCPQRIEIMRQLEETHLTLGGA